MWCSREASFLRWRPSPRFHLSPGGGARSAPSNNPARASTVSFSSWRVSPSRQIFRPGCLSLISSRDGSTMSERNRLVLPFSPERKSHRTSVSREAGRRVHTHTPPHTHRHTHPRTLTYTHPHTRAPSHAPSHTHVCSCVVQL